ncbi:uncharacterized protein [Hyperolius riggenbachi]|uniref:uncharacterized protein n=1 Tax=Hyperolius riggenbachi TaxID=752182 RepID=UPI0035A2ADC4
MVAEDHFGRLQARIYRSPPNQILSDITSPISSNVLSSTGGCVRSVGEKSHKASSSMPRRERILLANLSSTKTRRRLQAYSQPEASQQIHQIQEVQDGQHPLSAEPTTKGCIYDVSGPPRRLLTSTDPSGLTGVPEVCGPSSRRGSFYHLHKGRYVLTRTYDILIPGCPVGPTAFQTAPTVDFAGLEQGSQKSGQKGVHPLLHKNLASVVVGTKSAHSGLPVGLSNPEDHHYRRQQLGVGCSYGQFTNPGDLGQFLEASTLQHQGAGGSETSFVAFSGKPWRKSQALFVLFSDFISGLWIRYKNIPTPQFYDCTDSNSSNLHITTLLMEIIYFDPPPLPMMELSGQDQQALADLIDLHCDLGSHELVDNTIDSIPDILPVSYLPTLNELELRNRSHRFPPFSASPSLRRFISVVERDIKRLSGRNSKSHNLSVDELAAL